MRALITAGGTSEPIDDVRVVTNLSTGRLGAAIANALADRGAEVVLLAGRSLASHPEWVDPRVRVEAFGGFSDLQRALERHAEPRPDVVFMAAAVSDYSPAQASGKLSSAGDELVVVMKRNPKLLSALRDQLGPGPKIVGFKLLSGVETAVLLDTARRQVERDRLDLCVANDLRELGGGAHPVWLVPPVGEAVRVEGDKDEVARRIVAQVLGPEDGGNVDSAVADALALAIGAPFHPRLARVLPQRVVRARGAFGLADGTIGRSGPGTRAEADAIARAVAARPDPRGFVLHLASGDQAIGVADLAAARAAWAEIVAAHPEPKGRLVPVLAAGWPVGAVGADRDTRTLWIAPAHRGQGYGDRAALRLDALAARVWAPEPEGSWFAERGWRSDGPDTWLPPSSRAEWRPAASVCVMDPLRRAVLLGQRRAGPASGRWAFPGGRQEPGEPALAAALRELREETGIVLDEPLVLAEHVVHAGDYRITCAVIADLRGSAPAPTEEMSARWVPLAETSALRPMTAGTRRVIRSLLG